MSAEVDDSEANSTLIVDILKTCGINFIAVDFDQTLVECHTGGRWNGTVAELSAKIRPIFRSLIPRALNKSIFSIF